MFQLFFTPPWFNGWDIIIDGIILIVALLIAAYSWKIYRLNHENRYLYFSFALLLIGVGLLFNIITNSILYFLSVREIAAEILRPVAGAQLEFSYLLYRAGFFLQMVPMLGGWLLMFFISQKSRARLRKFYEVSQIALFIYLIVLVSIVSNFKYFVFYLTSAVLLALIVLNYYKNYLNTNKNENTLQVMWAFLLILGSQIAFVFVFLQEKLYVVAEILFLLGFLVLLATYRRITKQ